MQYVFNFKVLFLQYICKLRKSIINKILLFFVMLSAFLKRLLFARQFFIINGKIEVLGVKQVMFPSSLVLDFQEIDSKKVYDVTKKELKNTMSTFGKKLGASGEGLLKEITDIYETLGLGELQIVDLDNKSKKALVRVHNSPIAEAALSEKSKSKTPVCTIIAGALSGMFSHLFGIDVDSQEKVCALQKKDYCEFVIKSKIV